MGMLLQDYIGQAGVEKDPAALGYVAERCSALYTVFAKGLEQETDPERQKVKNQALNAGEKFMGVAVQSLRLGTTIELKDAMIRTRNIVVEVGNLYTDRIGDPRRARWVAPHETLLRTARDTRQHCRSGRATNRVVSGLPTPGRARSQRDGSALRGRHRRARLAQAADMLALRREGGRLRAYRRAAVRVAAIGTYRH